MSYDIYLKDPEGGHGPVELAEKHQLSGGTYAVGGTRLAELNVTYNYSQHFYRLLGDKGIRTIYGMYAEDAIPLLQKAADSLSGEPSGDYWSPTDGNVKKTLLDLIELAKLCPRGVFAGD